VVIVLLVLTFFVARSCQNDQIKVSQEEAVALAEKQIDFTSENTQIRLLRQGLDRHPFWIVSLSIPGRQGDDSREFRRLAVVRIDATDGKVASVQEQDVPGPESGARAHNKPKDR
jgi:hypothetical protein